MVLVRRPPDLGTSVEWRLGMSAIFELFRDDAGCYRFRLKSASGEVVALSDTYATRDGAEVAIESIRQSAATAFVDDKTRASVFAPAVEGG
jgi:uncharacterized protein YegP (UPF0339 family)